MKVEIVKKKTEEKEIDVEFAYNNVPTTETTEPIDDINDTDVPNEHFDVDF